MSSQLVKLKDMFLLYLRRRYLRAVLSAWIDEHAHELEEQGQIISAAIKQVINNEKSEGQTRLQ